MKRKRKHGGELTESFGDDPKKTKLEWLKEKGYERVMGVSDWSPYKAPSPAKKAVKKIKKKFKKS